MRRAVGVAFRVAAPLTLMCACLAACRPGDFDGLSRGESEGVDILSAKVALRRVGPASDAEPSSTMSVRVFDSDSVAPFDRAHLHATPSQHDPGSVWLGQAVGGFPVGASGAWTQSADLAALIQHVVDRSGFREGNYIGFVLSDAMPVGQYAQFRDSFAGEDPALLTITYHR